MADEWGPWIEHDGKGCPCIGHFVRALHCTTYGHLSVTEGIAGASGGHSWDWENCGAYTMILRYQIRRPKGVAVLLDCLDRIGEPA